MSPDDNPTDLLQMDLPGAAAFVREAEGRLCVRFYRRHDGTLLTDNCPVGWRAARRWLLTQMLGAFSFFGFGFGAIMRSVRERPHLLERVGHSGGESYVMGGPPGSVSEPSPVLPRLRVVIMVTPRPGHRHRRWRHGRRR